MPKPDAALTEERFRVWRIIISSSLISARVIEMSRRFATLPRKGVAARQTQHSCFGNRHIVAHLLFFCRINASFSNPLLEGKKNQLQLSAPM
ncbi:MAG: hypothetical protein CMQ45_01060 [Gammaproteobacteria bacterium]|nr:hypothetical protein [Gammaproteobacteria bacterium]